MDDLASYVVEVISDFVEGFLKSVSYHPDPFNLNAGAETFFAKVSLPHTGQFLVIASESFKKRSSEWKQLEHLYS